MHQIKSLLARIQELEALLEISERKADILTNLLKEANTEFEQAIEKVTISEANFRAIFATAPEAIFILEHQSYRILDCNPYAVTWLDYQLETLLNLPLATIMAVAPGDLERHQLISEKGTIRPFLRADGTWVHAEVVASTLEYLGRTCLLLMARDVTERRQLEELRRYKEIFASVSDPVFINDYQGRLLEVNEVACQHFGYTRTELLHMTWKNLIVPGQKHILQKTLQEIQKDRTIKFELETLTKTGEVIPFEFHARGIDYRGHPAVLSVARDLSLRRKLEQTLLATARLTAVGEMASGVAHNFNNLLQLIMSAAEAAQAKLASGKFLECQEAIRQIQTASHRGSEIVKRIQDFTRTQKSDLECAVVFDLGPVLREAIDLTMLLWKTLAADHHYELHLEIQEGCFIRGKPSELYEVFINLIKNAIEAMPTGGTLRIATAVVGDTVEITVADTGVGISEANLPRLFQPFFTTKGGQSSGLGLSSSYGIIKRHQGEIQVSSRVNQGTVFTIVFPRATGPTLAQSTATTPVGRTRIRFLLVEDEPHIIKAMQAYFEETEVDLVTCHTGQEALTACQRERFDVILCDLGLDDISGWEVGAHLKDYYQRQGVPKPPFLLYTGWNRSYASEQLAASGVDKVVEKPIACSELLRLLRQLTQPPVPSPGNNQCCPPDLTPH